MSNAFKMVKAVPEATSQLLRLNKFTMAGKEPNIYIVDGDEYDREELIKLANSVCPETWIGDPALQPRICRI